MKQRGVTLIEITLALAIIAAILLAITRIYYMVDNSNKVNSATTMILNVYQATAQYNQPFSQNQDLIPDFIARGYLPNDYSKETVNPWGGKITAIGLSADTFRVALTKVPSALCKNLKDKFKNMQNAIAECLLATDSNSFIVTFDVNLRN